MDESARAFLLGIRSREDSRLHPILQIRKRDRRLTYEIVAFSLSLSFSHVFAYL